MKRGQLGFMQTTILILLGAIILFFVIGKVFVEKANKSNEIEKCRSTALIVDKTRELSSSSVMDVDCKMNDVEITAQDITHQGELNEMMLYVKILEEMRWCWYKMGDGTFLPFDQNLVSSKFPCIICSRISFDPEIIRGLGPVLHNLDRALDRKMKNSDESYRNYLDTTQYQSWGFILYYYKPENSLKTHNQIDLNSDYYVIYQAALKGWVTSNEGALYKLFKSLQVSEHTGNYDNTYLHLVKADSISETGCGYVGNSLK
jgi:hypothetical protein